MYRILFSVFFIFTACAGSSAIRQEPAPLPQPTLTGPGTGTVPVSVPARHKARILTANPYDAEVNVAAKRRIVANLADTLALCETAETYLVEIGRNMQKMREIAVQAANGIYSQLDRDRMQPEAAALLDECTRILDHALFNSMSVFGNVHNAGIWPVTLDEAEPVHLFRLDGRELRTALGSVPKNGLLTPGSAQAALGTIDDVLRAWSWLSATVGAGKERFEAVSRWQQMHVRAGVDADRNEAFKNLRAERLCHVRGLEDRLFALAVQAANGVYSAEDRLQIGIAWREIAAELRRLEPALGFTTIAAGAVEDALATPASAEREMRRIAGILLGE
jgi:hypothetical protein